MTEHRLRHCLARIADLCAAEPQDASLGDIVLRAHQVQAVARVRGQLARHGGCLLADDVGRGKTYVALAVAARWMRPLVVVPAALRDSWRGAMARAGRPCTLVTHESLSRGLRPTISADGVIVDESHRFRNPRTRRYLALADLAARAELLLLSATPVQNSVRDLEAQLALYLGSGVCGAGATRLATHVVRVESADVEAGLPALAPPRWVTVEADDGAVLDAILALPPPPRALGVGDAGALRTIALVRAWASSRAALGASLARRRRTATAIEQGLEAGLVPHRSELPSWRGGGEPGVEVVQLGLTALLAAHAADSPEHQELRQAVSAEQRALEQLGGLVRERADPDVARARALAALAAAHLGERVLAFTELASTARRYHALLRTLPGVGLLTASHARIASGGITRRELVNRFAPRAQGQREPAACERVTLLISTDLLAEGVNLQDASVVVHLDLPWNPARLAQRVGRVRRPAGAATVASYLIAPPADTERLLEVETRLRHKLSCAERTIGHSIDVVPALTQSGSARTTDACPGAASATASLLARVAQWSVRGRQARPCDESPLVAAARSHRHGWLAVLADGRMLCSLDGVVTDDPGALGIAAASAEGEAREPWGDERGAGCAALHGFLAAERLQVDCGATTGSSAIARIVERRAAQLLQRVARHERAALVSEVATLRQLLAGPLTLGAERALAALAADHRRVAPADWLRRALSIVARRGRLARERAHGPPEVAVLILLGPAP